MATTLLDPNAVNQFQQGTQQTPRQVSDANVAGGYPAGLTPNQFTSGSAQQSAMTTQADQNTSQTAQQGTNTSLDTLGFGQLLKNTAPTAQSLDAQKNAALTPLANGSSPAYADLIAKAVKQGVSGPSMTGAGNEANIRGAATGASNANAQNISNQISAANSLGLPTTTSVANAAQPYAGTATSSQGASLSNDISQGLAQAYNDTFAQATGPTSTTTQSSGGGMSIICTAMYEQGLLPGRACVIGRKYARHVGFETYLGYHTCFKWLANLICKSRPFAVLFQPVADAWVHEMGYRIGHFTTGSRLGNFILTMCEPFCGRVGAKNVGSFNTSSDVAYKSTIL